VQLSDDDVERALFCVNESVGFRHRARMPVPPWMSDLGRRLDVTSLTCGIAAVGNESDCASSVLDTEALIGTREAAAILGLSDRMVRLLANDLEGEKVGGKHVFRLSTVIAYAQEKENGRRTIRGI